MGRGVEEVSFPTEYARERCRRRIALLRSTVRRRAPRRLSLCGVVIACCAVAGAAQAQLEGGVVSFTVGDDERVRIEVPSATDRYHVLYYRTSADDSATERAVALHLGVSGSIELSEPLRVGSDGTYRVATYSTAAPGDTDADGTDDLAELGRAEAGDRAPLNPATPIAHEDGAVAIPSLATFQRLSYQGTNVPDWDPHLRGMEHVKFHVSFSLGPNPALFFIDTNRWKQPPGLHELGARPGGPQGPGERGHARRDCLSPEPRGAERGGGHVPLHVPTERSPGVRGRGEGPRDDRGQHAVSAQQPGVLPVPPCERALRGAEGPVRRFPRTGVPRREGVRGERVRGAERGGGLRSLAGAAGWRAAVLPGHRRTESLAERAVRGCRGGLAGAADAFVARQPARRPGRGTERIHRQRHGRSGDRGDSSASTSGSRWRRIPSNGSSGPTPRPARQCRAPASRSPNRRRWR